MMYNLPSYNKGTAMAFTGTHITYGRVKTVSPGAALMGAPDWSESMATPGTTDKAATLDTTADCFLIQPTADIWVSVAPVPNAAVDHRMLIRGGEAVTIPCAKGDRVAWVLA